MIICLEPKFKLKLILLKRNLKTWLMKYLPHYVLCRLGMHKWIIRANQHKHQKKCKYCNITRDSLKAMIERMNNMREKHLLNEE